ncbi:MAG: DMT family transporter [Polaromonas sp.]|nr:DMT family transporter [Polaromonas sp.]
MINAWSHTEKFRTVLVTSASMLAFAGNSLLCRIALNTTEIDPASFTAIRLASGAIVLWLLMSCRHQKSTGSWLSALALFVYATAFSFAYAGMSAGTGALLLFGTVQLTMLGTGLCRGERLGLKQAGGLCIAIAGVSTLLIPSATAPTFSMAMLMVLAGLAWAIYSLRGKRAGDPAQATAGNFIRASPMALLLLAVWLPNLKWELAGVWYAILSGAFTSALGYVVWYAATTRLKATTAASAQLSVPALTAIGGALLLGEATSWQLLASCVAVLGGVALASRP